MVQFLLRRLARTIASLIGVVAIVFFIVRLNGNPAVLLLGPNATPEGIATLNAALGLDESLPLQFVRFVSNLAHGDLGTSITFSQPALNLLLDRLGLTLLLAFLAFVFGGATAFGLALIAELWGSTRVRDGLLWFGALVQAIPQFLLGVLLILAFAIQIRWLPALGNEGPSSYILPVLTLGSYEVALYIRLFSVAFAEQGRQDYVRTALAKGKSRTYVVLRHVLPNAVLPIITVAGLHLGQLLGGTVVVETVFNWPGAGRLIYQAVNQRDYPVVQAGVLVIATLFIVVNLAVDLLYAALDPRVRLS